MNAIGLILVKFIYVILAIPLIVQLLKFFLGKQKDFQKVLAYSLPFIFWIVYRYDLYLQEGKANAGTYSLANYPKCDR